MRIDVVSTAAALDCAALRRSTVLVIDVLRASTTIIAALASGCRAVIPAAGPAAARRRAGTLPAGATLLAGERRGEPIPGFDLGNSPLEMTAERVRDKVIVFTTSNGTRALLASRGAPAVGVAALVNLSAAAAWALAGGRDVMLLCAGQRGDVALEDQVCAGLLVDRLLREGGAAPTEASIAACRAASRYGRNLERLARDSRWARHLVRRGHAADVAACLALDAASLVPVFRPDVDNVVAGFR